MKVRNAAWPGTARTLAPGYQKKPYLEGLIILTEENGDTWSAILNDTITVEFGNFFYIWHDHAKFSIIQSILFLINLFWAR